MVPPTPFAPSARILRTAALAVALHAAFVPVTPADAQAARIVGPITFEGDEWLGVDANDLEVDDFDGTSVPGISFAFAGADASATAAVRVGPEDAAYVQGQGLEGPTDGVLTVEFAQPVVGFQAGMAFLGNRAESEAVRLRASDAQGGQVLDRGFSSSVTSATLFPGTLIKVELENPATRIELRVVSTARRFFLDNLVFTFAGSGLPTVEPPDATVFEGRASKARMAHFADGRSVAVWPEDGAVRFQTISAIGKPEGAVRAATATSHTGWSPAVTTIDGGFALLWYGRANAGGGSAEGVYLGLHAADGSTTRAKELLFSPDTRRATRIALGVASAGQRLIVTWDDGEKSGVVRYDLGDGSLNAVPLTADSSRCGVHAAAFAASTAVFWCSDEVWAQFYDARNVPVGNPLPLSEGLAGDPTSLVVQNDRQAGSPSRALAWMQEGVGGKTELYVRTITSVGALSPAVQVSANPSRGFAPSVAGHSDGSFLVAWLGPNRQGSVELPRRLWTQVFFASGAAATDPREPMADLKADPESVAIVWDGQRATLVWENSISSPTLPGSYLSTFLVQPDQTPCRASAKSLCLQRNRFQVTVQFRDFDGGVGHGRPVGLTGDTGYFWFFDQGAADLVVKVLDGRTTNGHHWVFFGSLTNVAFDLMVEDRLTGQTATYSNELGSFASAGDTRAFGPDDSASAATGPASPAAETLWSRQQTVGMDDALTAGDEEQGLCASALRTNPLAACLSERFLVEIEWEDFGGSRGEGHGQAISSDTASFWFFEAANLELVIKVLDGTSINDHFWVYFGSLTNVAFDLTVTDLETGSSRNWSNPRGVFASEGDTTALPAD